MSNHNALYSSMVRAGKTTYFVDVKEAKNGKRYLSITENRLDGDEKKSRSVIRVLSESVNQFRQAVNEATTVITQ